MRKRPDLYQQKNYKEIPKFSPNIYQNYPQQSRTPLNLTQSQSYRNLPFPVNTNLSSPKNQHIYQSQSYQNLPQNSSNIPLVNPYATPKNINPFIDYSKYLAFQQPIYSKTSPKSYSENPIVGYGREAQNNTPRKMSNYGSMLVKPR